jgi:HEAT repeat protein
MNFPSSSFLVGLLLAALVPTIAQNSAPPTIAEALQKHHVAVTRPSLLVALRSPDAEVRGLAAAQLAEDKANDEIPAIEQALAVEQVSGTKVNIAFALGELGNASGVDALKRSCHDSGMEPVFRVRAAQYMLDLRSNVCLRDTLDLLETQSSDISSDLTGALSLVPQFKNVTVSESQELLAAVLRNLENAESSARMSAGNALAELRDSSAIPYLQNAITAESDEVGRESLENALQRLQRSQ